MDDPSYADDGAPASAILRLSRMALSPVAQHLIGHLIGIANRFGQRLYGLVSALARMAARILCLILAHAPAGIARLAFLHDPLPDPIVREALECFGVCARQIWVQQWCLSIEPRIERDEQNNSDQADFRKCFHATYRR
jgi:hypothetical protein